MRDFIESVEAEFKRYKVLGERAMSQMDESALSAPGPGGGNSVAVLVWHIAGNLASRFSDFLTSDGEKPWRQREEEFADRAISREDLIAKWQSGWGVLLQALGALGDQDLEKTVTIRGVSLKVVEALHRSLAHTSYHVGQIVYLAKSSRGADWSYLSIPPGGSDAYNKNPRFEKASGHVQGLETDRKDA